MNNSIWLIKLEKEARSKAIDLLCCFIFNFFFINCFLFSFELNEFWEIVLEKQSNFAYNLISTLNIFRGWGTQSHEKHEQKLWKNNNNNSNNEFKIETVDTFMFQQKNEKKKKMMMTMELRGGLRDRSQIFVLIFYIIQSTFYFLSSLRSHNYIIYAVVYISMQDIKVGVWMVRMWK